jgi:hypothetical protein
MRSWHSLPTSRNGRQVSVVRSVTSGGMEWFADTPSGPMKVRFTEPNRFGVLDHSVTFLNGDGTEVVFSLLQRPGMSDQDFERDAEWVARDLRALKRLLEPDKS